MLGNPGLAPGLGLPLGSQPPQVTPEPHSWLCGHPPPSLELPFVAGRCHTPLPPTISVPLPTGQPRGRPSIMRCRKVFINPQGPGPCPAGWPSILPGGTRGPGRTWLWGARASILLQVTRLKQSLGPIARQGPLGPLLSIPRCLGMRFPSNRDHAGGTKVPCGASASGQRGAASLSGTLP